MFALKLSMKHQSFLKGYQVSFFNLYKFIKLLDVYVFYVYKPS